MSRHCARVLHTHLRNQLLMPFKSQQPALAGGDLHMGDPRPQLDAVTHAFREAYRQTDLELAATPSGRMAGSTAVSVLLGPTCVWAANCGRHNGTHPEPVRGFEQQAPKGLGGKNKFYYGLKSLFCFHHTSFSSQQLA